MAFEVRMGSFAKKHNSTARPSNLPTVMQCVLKDEFDLLTGEIGLDFGFQNSTPIPHNYAYIPIFRRYYFIESWEWRDRLWWAKLKVDVLGTYKEAIGTQTLYVLRSASEYDTSISDSLYPSYPHTLSHLQTLTRLWALSDFRTGSYVLGVVGRGGSAGAVNYYHLTPAQFGSLKEFLLSDSDYLGIDDISPELTKALFNPFQYIVSAMWFPLPRSAFPNLTSANVSFGWWNSDISGYIMGSLHTTQTYEFVAHPHPAAVSEGLQFLFASPFSSYTLYFPPFGEIDLPADVLGSEFYASGNNYSADIHLDIKIDFATGEAFVRVCVDNGEGQTVLAYREARLGVPVQLGQITADVGAGVTNVLGGIGGLITSLFTNPVGAIGGFASSIYNGIQSAAPKAKLMGNNGSEATSSLYPEFYVQYHPRVAESISEFGRPLCDTKRIDTLSGYIQTLDADISITGATMPEQSEIKAFLDGGFFYE